MNDWIPEDFRRVADTLEIDIATIGRDGALRPYTPIWIVSDGAELYIRSYRGAAGAWYRNALREPRARIRAGGTEYDVVLAPDTSEAVNAAIDIDFRRKYSYSPTSLAAMIRPEAVATTLRVRPA